MAETAFHEENRGSFAVRALGFSTAFFFCALTAGALVITLLGSSGRPGVILNLSALTAPAPVPQPRAVAEAPPPAARLSPIPP